MDQQTEVLRKALERSRNGVVRWRCPSHLKAEVVSYITQRREEGARLAELGTALGLSESTLTRWSQQASGRIEPVRVVAGTSAPGGVIVVTPRGYRVEGLTVASAAELLGRL